MKKKPLILGTLAVAMLVSAGCNKADMPDSSSTTSDTNSMPENVKEIATNAWQKTKEVTTNVVTSVEKGTTNAWADIKESLQSATDYTYDKKDAFVASASADADALDQKIKDLSDKVANASDSVKTSAQAKLQDLNAKRADLGKKLDDVKNSTEANWNDVKTGFKNSYNDVKDSLKQAWQSLTTN
jgi:vacuolar-type H+-ATPase subunit I/STV1